MSQESAAIVRTPLSVRRRSSRTLDQRLCVLFPRLGAATARLIGKRPPKSRLRRVALPRAVRLASEAYNRRDLAAVVIGWHPECEYLPGREWIEAGLVEPCYRGAEGYRRYVAATSEVWGAENYLMPEEVIDLGERFVVLANVPMRAQASGVSLTEAFAYVATLKDGRPIRFQEYFDHDAALKAVGLAE
jgi:ketosteroid isomerase-like protein